MGSTWVLSAPDGPHVGTRNLVISASGSHTLWFSKHPLSTYRHIVSRMMNKRWLDWSVGNEGPWSHFVNQGWSSTTSGIICRWGNRVEPTWRIYFARRSTKRKSKYDVIRSVNPQQSVQCVWLMYVLCLVDGCVVFHVVYVVIPHIMCLSYDNDKPHSPHDKSLHNHPP